MHKRTTLALIVFIALTGSTVNAWEVTIDWRSVGNPGNAADTTGFGRVNDAYRIGTYDVTNNQYVQFLNTIDPNAGNPYGIYNFYMSDPSSTGGIQLNSSGPLGSKYSVIPGRGNHPVTYVSVYSALRFANWINNGQGHVSINTGAYTLQGYDPTPTNRSLIPREAGAKVFLPSQNEWYKAAYYNPATSSYFRFPTSSNEEPNVGDPTGAPNTANLSRIVGHPTDVGAYTGTKSPYGAFDMGGNVYQYTQDIRPDPAGFPEVHVRGSSWFHDYLNMLSSIDHPQFVIESGTGVTGFRLASVPEPSSFILAALSLAGLAAYRWRKLIWRRV